VSPPQVEANPGKAPGARSAALGLWVALAVLAAVALLGYASTEGIVDTMRHVEHSHRTIDSLDELRGALSESESARRGFALTGDEALLAPYAEATARLRASQARLRRIAGEGDQPRRFDDLDREVTERLAMLDAAVADRQGRAHDERRDSELTRNGTAVTKRLSAKLSTSIDDERQLLLAREHLTTRSVRLTRILQGLGTAASFVLLVLAFTRLQREIGRRFRSEQLARESEHRLATTLDSIGDGVIATDREGRIARVNPAAERLTGWNASEANGQPITDVFRLLSGTTRDPVEGPVARVLREGVVMALARDTCLVAKD
jgi:PAS domain-containing protein